MPKTTGKQSSWQNAGSFDPKPAPLKAIYQHKPRAPKNPKTPKKQKTQQPLFRESNPHRSTHTLTFYADGGCSPNPGRGGWGWVCRENLKEDFGGEDSTTNNRMELTGILAVLLYVKTNHPNERILVISDSQYAINGCSRWRHKWKQNNWKAAEGALKNSDLWKRIDSALDTVKAEFEWVRGHDGNKWNERADELTQLGAGRAVNRSHQNTPKVPEIKHAEPCKTRQKSALDTILDLWDRGGFTPAFELAITEIKRLQGLQK